MKYKYIFYTLLFYNLFFISCQNNYNYHEEKERYVNILDTFYNDNSSEINSIRRTFYKYTSPYSFDSTEIILTQKLGDTSFQFWIKDYKDTSITFAFFNNDKELNMFFEDMRDVAENNISHSFGANQTGTILLADKSIMLLNRNWITKMSNGISFEKSEIDSMQSSFNLYKAEKK